MKNEKATGRDAVRSLVLDPNDNVGVLAVSGVEKGQAVQTADPAERIFAGTMIPRGHKIAIKEIPSNRPIIKYGQVIGKSTRKIARGEHVHVHNVRSIDKVSFTKPHSTVKTERPGVGLPGHFNGYLRKDGRAGVRNYLLVMSTVNCSATVVREIAAAFRDRDLSRYGLDGIVPVTHSSGCAQAVGGLSYNVLNKTLAGWLDHPNVVGTLVVGLGCEVVTLESLKENIVNTVPMEYLSIQDEGGARKAIKRGIDTLERMIAALPRFKRVRLPVSLLNVALNCGGSDAFSSITANPALGFAGDIVVSRGGTIVLAEIPECNGAKEYLSGRCVRKTDRERMSRIFDWWDKYAEKNNVTINDNISCGNIKGGISTILEKSLGAIAKAGSSDIQQVVQYAERITRKGLVVMDTPGFDPVSVTGLVAGGCNIVAFTTGRGSVFGCSIAPTVKIATSTELFRALKEDMDLNAGTVLNTNTIADAGKEIYRYLIRVADGWETFSEKQGLGKEEFVPWPVGETL
ncbi:MAG: UxaA family hydrolase [Endomicrobiales bacterium]